jgi:hypothetical protein
LIERNIDHIHTTQKSDSTKSLGRIDCDVGLSQVDEFAEMYFIGKPVPEGLKVVEQHLSICNECREEFEA